MTKYDLITQAREDILFDARGNQNWTDRQLERFADEAIMEACIRAPLLTRVKTVAVVAGTAGYPIDLSIRQIMVAKLDLLPRPLSQATDAQLSMSRGVAWRERTGVPTHYVRFNHNLTLYPNPTNNDTLVLSTSNVPDAAFDLDMDIDNVWHRPMIFYICYRALMMRDMMDTYDPVKANDMLGKFEAAFGIRHSAQFECAAFNTPAHAEMWGGFGGRIC